MTNETTAPSRPRFGKIPAAVNYSGRSRGRLYQLASMYPGLFKKDGASTLVDFAVLDKILDDFKAVDIQLGPSSWTDERIERLKQLWAEGYSASQIATDLGGNITRNAVISKACRIGLRAGKKQPKPQPQRRKRARAIAVAVALMLLAMCGDNARAETFVQPKPLGVGCPLVASLIALHLVAKTNNVGRFVEVLYSSNCVLFDDKTPGPWKVESLDDDDGLVLIERGDELLWTRPESLQVLK
jgi:GcrA cell cycle regulator